MSSPISATALPFCAVSSRELKTSSTGTPCSNQVPVSSCRRSILVSRIMMRSTTSSRSAIRRNKLIPTLTSSADKRLSVAPGLTSSALKKLNSGPLKRQRAFMPENSTCIPIAALAQPFISSWYSGNCGNINRKMPTAIASTITSAAPILARYLISFRNNFFILVLRRSQPASNRIRSGSRRIDPADRGLQAAVGLPCQSALQSRQDPWLPRPAGARSRLGGRAPEACRNRIVGAGE